MAKAETSPFSAEHIAQFHRIQQVRKQILHKMGNLLEVWRNCENKACQRAKSCRRDDATCLYAFMQAMPDEDRRFARYAIENGSAGLDPQEAMDKAQARVDDEIARHGG